MRFSFDSPTVYLGDFGGRGSVFESREAGDSAGRYQEPTGYKRQDDCSKSHRCPLVQVAVLSVTKIGESAKICNRVLPKWYAGNIAGLSGEGAQRGRRSGLSVALRDVEARQRNE